MKTWKPQLLSVLIAETLERKGSMTDIELFEILREENENLGFSEFNKTLLGMELSGVIRVSFLSKGKRTVELIKKKT
jgi:hypothetical protein